MVPAIWLGPGRGFGELALQQDPDNPNKTIPRAASIYSLTKCDFATMKKKDYQLVLQKIDQKNLDTQIKFLQSIPFFKPLKRSRLKELFLLMIKRPSQRGQIICSEGNPADKVFIVNKGEFELKASPKGVLVNAAARTKVKPYQREQFLEIQRQSYKNGNRQRDLKKRSTLSMYLDYQN